MKKTMKSMLSLVLAALVAFCLPCSLLPASAAEFAYPAGQTRERVEATMVGTDSVLAYAAQKMTGKTLPQNAMEGLCGGALLSELLVGVYSTLSGEDMADMLTMLKLKITPADLAAVLFSYTEVAAALQKASMWESVDLKEVSWNVDSKAEFAVAVGAILSPLDTLLRFLLCEGSIDIVGNVIHYSGGKGYETAVVPIYDAIGCTGYLSYADYKKQAESSSNAAGANLILPLLDYVEWVMAAPLGNSASVLPNVGFFVQNKGFDNAITALLEPVTKITSFLAQMPLLSSLISGNFASLTTDLSGNLVPNINKMIASSGINLSLDTIDWAALAACGTQEGTKVVANKGQTFVTVIRWLWGNLQNNRAALLQLANDTIGTSSDSRTGQSLSNIVTQLLEDDADAAINFLSLFIAPEEKAYDFYWVYGDTTPGAYTFTEAMPRENYAQMRDGFDSMLGSLLAEMGGASSLKAMLRNTLYTNDTVTKLLKAVYTALSGEDIAGIASLMELDTSVAGALAVLTDEKYVPAATFLKRYISWAEVPENGIDWGFQDGDREGFVAALAAVLRPFEPLLGCLLAEKDFVFCGSVTLQGNRGYNNVIIPVFEALGVDPDTYKSFSDYAAGAGTDSVLTDLLIPLFVKLESVCDAPVTYIASQLPTLAYFLSDGGLQKCIYALVAPLIEICSAAGISLDFDQLLTSFSGYDLTFPPETMQKLLSDLQSSETLDFSIALPAILPLSQLAGLGTVIEAPSKRTYDGAATTYKLVVADKESVLAYVVDFIIDMLRMPENANLLTGSIGGAGEEGEANPFASYTESFTAELSSMTHEDMVLWLYNLLNTESVAEPVTETSNDEVPQIIYTPEETGLPTAAKIAIAVGVLAIAAVVVLLLVKKKKKQPAAAEQPANEAAEV